MSKKQKIFFITFIALIATFLRFFRIYETAPFLGDQGRDLIEIRKSLLAGKIPLRGPLSNLGIHAGPVYYYLLIPPLLLTNFHPLGPTLLITFLGVINSLLVYQIGNKLFGHFPSFLAAMLYASSPIVIQRTRGIWNPVPLPFFVLVIIFSLLQIQKKKRLSWLTLLGLFLGIAVQLYPPAYFLFIPVFSWWLYLFFKKIDKKKRFNLLKWSIIGGLTLFLTLIPFLFFQTQNRFIDLRNILLIFWEKIFAPAQLRTDFSIFNSFFTLLGQQFMPFTLNQSVLLNAGLGIIVITFPFFFKEKSKLFWHLFWSLWLLGGIFVIIFLVDIIYPHYFSFIWPLPFLLLTSLIGTLEKFFSKKILFGLGIFLVLLNLKAYFNAPPPANELNRAEMTADFIIREAKKRPFSLVLISRNSPSDSHLRYFLNLKGANLKSTKNKASDLLFLVCAQDDCPSVEVVLNSEIAESECLPVCPSPEEKKTINFKNWQFVSTKNLFEGQVYLFQKPN